MDDHIRTTIAAKEIIATRRQLARIVNSDIRYIEAIVSNPRDFYHEFTIPKKNGEPRTIRPPFLRFRNLQRLLLMEFYRRTSLRSCLHGSIPGKSIITHARAHVDREMVCTLDIRKFFPSTNSAHLLPVFTALGFVDEAAEVLLRLVTLDNALPQGAPTSAILANLAFAPGDTNNLYLCRKHTLRYSRYVDDIAISGDRDFRHLEGAFLDVIKACGYEVADDKIHFRRRDERQIITGLIVNRQLRPTKEFIDELKATIRSCMNHGAAIVACGDGISIKKLKAQLTGRVSHVRQIDEKLGNRLRGRLCSVDWRSKWTYPQMVGALRRV
ncbi:MAG: reverse transcriptase family protein [Planctomycetaceae bacterium]